MKNWKIPILYFIFVYLTFLKVCDIVLKMKEMCVCVWYTALYSVTLPIRYIKVAKKKKKNKIKKSFFFFFRAHSHLLILDRTTTTTDVQALHATLHGRLLAIQPSLPSRSLALNEVVKLLDLLHNVVVLALAIHDLCGKTVN